MSAWKHLVHVASLVLLLAACAHGRASGLSQVQPTSEQVTAWARGNPDITGLVETYRSIMSLSAASEEEAQALFGVRRLVFAEELSRRSAELRPTRADTPLAAYYLRLVSLLRFLDWTEWLVLAKGGGPAWQAEIDRERALLAEELDKLIQLGRESGLEESPWIEAALQTRRALHTDLKR